MVAEIPRAEGGNSWGTAVLAAAILFAAAIPRVWASQAGLWLDEVWSTLLLQDLASPLGVLNAVHHDNNHHLNSWYLLAIGTPREFFVYRLHSIIAGIGVVVLGVLSVRRDDRTGRLLTALLLGSSYLLIHYASEARGYSLMLFFAFASYLVTRRFLDRPTLVGMVLYWCCAILGFLSHLSFLHVAVGVAAWTAVALWKREPSRREAAFQLAVYHGVPLLFVLALWWVDLRFLQRGGGPDYRLSQVVAATFSTLVGGPAAGPGAWVAALIAALASAIGLVSLGRERGTEWVFFGVVMFASPALLLLATDPEVLFVRYFLVSVAFGLLLMGGLLAKLWRRGRLGAWGAAAFLAWITLGNARHSAELLRPGRGSFHDVLVTLSEQDPDDTITVTGTNPRLDSMMLSFYARFLPADQEIRYLQPEELPTWLLASRRDEPSIPRKESEMVGHRYRLVASFFSPPMSGADWFVYRLKTGESETDGDR